MRQVIKRMHVIDTVVMILTCAISAYVGYYSAHYFNAKTPIISALWCTTSAVTVAQENLRDTVSVLKPMLLGSVIGAALAYALFTMLGVKLWVFLLIVGVIYIGFSCLSLRGSIRLSILTVAVIFFVKFHSPQHGSQVIFYIGKLFEALAGCFISGVLVYLSTPIKRIFNL